MKRTLMLMALLSSFAGWAQVKLEFVVKPGSKLIYSVKSDLGEYTFTVTVNDLKGSSFSWEMSAPANMRGEITHTQKALQSAYKVYTFYQSESKTLDDKSLGVWISQKLFADLAKGVDAVKVCLNNPVDEPAVMKAFADGDYVFKVDGDGTKIHDKFVKPAFKTKDNKWLVDPRNDNYFTYYNSPLLPIIVRLHTSYLTMSLKEVKTKV